MGDGLAGKLPLQVILPGQHRREASGGTSGEDADAHAESPVQGQKPQNEDKYQGKQDAPQARNQVEERTLEQVHGPASRQHGASHHKGQRRGTVAHGGEEALDRHREPQPRQEHQNHHGGTDVARRQKLLEAQLSLRLEQPGHIGEEQQVISHKSYSAVDRPQSLSQNGGGQWNADKCTVGEHRGADEHGFLTGGQP